MCGWEVIYYEFFVWIEKYLLGSLCRFENFVEISKGSVRVFWYFLFVYLFLWIILIKVIFGKWFVLIIFFCRFENNCFVNNFVGIFCVEIFYMEVLWVL